MEIGKLADVTRMTKDNAAGGKDEKHVDQEEKEEEEEDQGGERE